MYKDIKTNYKIAGIYALLNNKSELLYDKVFEKIINIIILKRSVDIDAISIIIETELALIKSLKKYFTNAKRIGCYFHYKQDIMRNISKYGLCEEKD